MPIYEYRCDACEQKFDKLIRSLSRIPETIHCPHCHSPKVNRLISAPAIRTGGAGEGDTAAANTSTSGETPVIGRKEIQAAQKKKAELKERAKHNDWD